MTALRKTAGNRGYAGVAVLIGLLAAIILGAGIWLGKRLADQAYDKTTENLRSVATLKVNELSAWLDEKTQAMTYPDGNMSAILAERWLAGGGKDEVLAVSIQSRMAALQGRAHGSNAVWLYDTQGVLRLGSAGSFAHEHGVDAAMLARAEREHRAVIGDLHLETAGGKTMVDIDIVTPLFVEGTDGGRLVGYLVHQFDVQHRFYPIIGAWPLPSASGELLLFRVEEGEIVFLSPLRHRPEVAPLGLRLRVDQNRGLLASQAILRGRMVGEGRDYAGRHVVGIVAPVPGTTWHLMAKLDSAEAFAPMRRDLAMVALVTGVLLLSLAVVVVYALRTAKLHRQALVAEEALARREAEERSEFFVRYARDIVLLFDFDTDRIVDANEAAAHAYGYDCAQLLNMSGADLRPPESRAPFAAEIGMNEGLGVTFESLHRRRDGSTFPVEINARVLKFKGRFYRQGIIRDIAERKAAERRLRESEQRYREIVDSNLGEICRWRPDTTLTFVNPAYAEARGLPAADLLGRRWLEFVPEGERAAVQLLIDDLVANPRRRYYEHSAVAADGQLRWGAWTDIPDIDESGRLIEFQSVGLDVTARKMAEDALAASEARYRAIVDSLGEAIFVHDLTNGSIIDTNLAATLLYGYDHQELLQLRVADLSENRSPYTEAEAGERVRQAAAGQPQRFEWRARDKDGHLFWVEVSLRRALIGDQDSVIAVVHDIESRKAQADALARNLAEQRELNRKLEEAQNQLLQSEKMSAIGQLAAGVAHEINNPVGFVSSNLGSLASYIDDILSIVDAYEAAEREGMPALERVRALSESRDFAYIRGDVRQLLAESQEGLARVRKIVQDLKDFSRVGEAEWQWADLRQGLDSTLNIVWHELKYHCTVQKNYGDLPEIWCLPSQLNQVFMNLLVNAGHAIEGRGEISIACGRQGDDAIWVSVTDSGKGIAQEHVNRIFEPFFTTKPVGKGTGLGLSLAYGIVQRHRGRIEVTSEVGVGTTFTVVLPVRPTTDGVGEGDK